MSLRPVAQGKQLSDTADGYGDRTSMSVVRHTRLPALRAPIVVMAFGGWGDAAEASSTAATTLANQWNCQSFATIDPDEFYDFTQVRPRVYLSKDMVREIEWPLGTFSFRRRPKAENDVIVFRALEPQLRWQRYSTGILDFLERLHVSMVISLGSLLADVPHTRPVQITGFATTPGLQRKLQAEGVSLSQYEGPTGIVGVLHQAAASRDIPSMSLWAAAPHYISAAANPAVALALLERMAVTLSWSLDLSAFRQEVKEFETEVDAIIQSNPEASAYVSQLEDQASQEPVEGPIALPPNDVLLRDLEEFLRRGPDDGRGETGKA